jgi:hypothetical protein
MPRSKKRSSTSGPPEPVFFTDRDLGPSVAAALREGGLKVEAYHEHFVLDNVPDGEWLRLVGAKGWIALSHNKRIRYERDELDDLMSYRVKAFFIIGKGPHRAFAAAVLRNLRKVLRLLRENEDPFVARIYQEREEVSLWVTYEQWKQGR